MNAIAFDPWVGSLYRSSSSRLLIVGESHYGEPDETPAIATQSVVRRWQSGQWNVRYLVAAARLISGLEAHEVDRQKVLERIAFYNYVQVMMSHQTDRPSTEDVLLSSPAFRDVLGLLDPTHILVTGKLVWGNMPEFDKGNASIELGEKSVELGEYRTPSGLALAMPIPHLSRYFSPPEWHNAVKSFLLLNEIPLNAYL